MFSRTIDFLLGLETRRLPAWLTVMVIAFALAAGCAPKVVRPVPPPGPPAPFSVPVPGGPIAEQQLQAVQAQLQTVYFGYDQYMLTPQAQMALQQDAELLRRAPMVRIQAEGHCDERGTAEYNLALGERRARAVVDYLASLGIHPQRMSTVSYGSELPADPGHNEAAWAKNRRVYLRVIN